MKLPFSTIIELSSEKDELVLVERIGSQGGIGTSAGSRQIEMDKRRDSEKKALFTASLHDT